MGMKWEVDEDGNASGESIATTTAAFTSATISIPPVGSSDVVTTVWVDVRGNGIDPQ